MVFLTLFLIFGGLLLLMAAIENTSVVEQAQKYLGSKK